MSNGKRKFDSCIQFSQVANDNDDFSLSLSQSYTLKQETVNGGLGLNSLKLHHLGAKTYKNSLNFDRLFSPPEKKLSMMINSN